MARALSACSAMLLCCAPTSEPQTFPAGLQPLEELEVECPSITAASPELASGEAEDFAWTHGCWVFDATLDDVYLALQDTEVAVDQRSVDEWSREDNVEPEYEVSFALQNTVYDIITVEFETTWRAGRLSETDKDTPTTIGARYQMTEAPNVITLLEGSVYAAALSSGGVEVQIIDHLDALQGGTDITSLKVQDLFADIEAHIEGRPIPSHRD